MKINTTLFRFNNWGLYIVPPILSVATLTLCSQLTLSINDIVKLFFLFITTLLVTAAFGYFLNDFADIETDALANKPNFASKIDTKWHIPILFSLLIVGFSPWLVLYKNPYGKIGFSIWLLEITLFFVYSIPPVRLKNRAFWGIICDTLYSHVLPIGMAIAIFSEHKSLNFCFLTLFFCLLCVKGLRNIILHQIQDRKADRLSNTHTFVRSYGTVKSVNLVNKVFVPLEIAFNFIVSLSIYAALPVLFWSFTIFILWYSIVIWCWSKRQDAPWRWHNRFFYFLNNYYEGWLPYIAAFLFLDANNLSFFWILVLALLCSSSLLRLYKEASMVVQKFQDLGAYFLSKTRKKMRAIFV